MASPTQAPSRGDETSTSAGAPAPARLARPRLIALLGERFGATVTVLSAPAGFGKTTLVDQARAENRLAPQGIDAPLACTAAHAVGSALLDALARALGAPASSSGPTPAQLADLVWHRSPDHIALVLDDVQEIAPGSTGAAALAALVATLPANGHLVLAGRGEPPIPLARLDVEGRVRRIGPADLAFTDDELEELARCRGADPRRLARCGGWPALVELALAAAPGVAGAYLWEEVLADIVPGRRRDLGCLAHIGPFDDDLAAAALDRPGLDVDALLAGFPLVAMEAGGRRTIHALWKPHLAGCATADDLAAARRRAGRHLAAAGEVAAAIDLLDAAGAWEDVARVMVNALGADHPPVAPDVTSAWRARLPSQWRGGGLGLLLEGVALVQRDFPAGVRVLTDAAGSFRDEGEVAGEFACLAQLALAAWWREDSPTLTGVVVRMLDLDGGGVGEAAALALLARALVHDAANECDVALGLLDRIAPGALNAVWASLIDWLRSLWLNHLGRPAEALAAADRAALAADPLLAPLVESARVQARWFMGLGDGVPAALGTVLDDIEAAGLRDHAAVVAASCAAVLGYAGRPDEAAPYLERARAQAAGTPVPLIDVNVAVATAAVAVAEGDEATATRSLERYLDRAALLEGHAAAPQQRTLALWYVLVPRTRPQWDATPLGPSFALARDLARAVVAGRAGARGPSPGLRWATTARAHLPLPWLAELALTQIDEGRPQGWEMLETAWPRAREAVRASAAPGGALARPARAALARLPVPPAGHLELRLLGPTELRRDGIPVDAPEWRRERVRSLLANLVLNRPVGRERVADELWPALDAEAQSRNLRVTLSYLLRVVEPDRRERDASFLVAPHGSGLLLHRGEWFTADVWRFDELWEQATDADRRGLPSVALGHMREAVDLWRGPPTDLLDDWALPDLEERTRRLVALAARAGELLVAHDEPDEALRLAGAALRADPWCDRAHLAVIAAHRATGDELAARRAIARHRDAQRELGT